MLLHAEQPAPPLAPLPASRNPWRTALLALVVVALAAGVGAAGFFLGQGTRKSDGEVARLTSAAVAGETRRQDGLQRIALNQLEARGEANLRRVVRRMKRAAKRRAEKSFAAGQSAGYSSGQSVGFTSGKQKGEEEGYANGSVDGYISGSEDGYDNGLTDGSDELSCSDDPDVSWLPPCF